MTLMSWKMTYFSKPIKKMWQFQSQRNWEFGGFLLDTFKSWIPLLPEIIYKTLYGASLDNKKKLYMFYKNDRCPQKHIDPVSICTFSIKFENNNLGLFRPKKDLCDRCESLKTRNIEKEDYEACILRKEAGRMEKDKDQENTKYITFIMDLQVLLMCPKSNVSSLYYKNENFCP